MKVPSINRYIKHWFRKYDPSFPFCTGCRSLDDYYEISSDDTREFPEAADKLVHLKELKLSYNSDGSFKICPDCHAYYWYRSWEPGGSDDAFKTVEYRSIAKTGLLGLYIELMQSREELGAECSRYNEREFSYQWANERYTAFVQASKRHFDYLEKQGSLLIEDTLVCLAANASLHEESKYYREDLLPVEEYAAGILLLFLDKAEKGRERYRERLEPLKKHCNPKVSALISDYLG